MESTCRRSSLLLLLLLRFSPWENRISILAAFQHRVIVITRTSPSVVQTIHPPPSCTAITPTCYFSTL
uniref:Putative secreted protein n=1 Tax=Anopheles marajoara TaxID=58244 RepID=A0A2M4CF44_9DIPT